MIQKAWVYCPICNNKTRIQIRGDTELRNFPLFCPKCKQEILIHLKEMQMLAQQQDMKIPSELIPRCPVCGAPMTMNLRCDDTFVQDRGWYAAQSRYAVFLQRHKQGKVLYLELGVGNNTPGIIKYPFWRYTLENPDAAYACVNLGQANVPREIADRSVFLNMDIGQALTAIHRVNQ